MVSIAMVCLVGKVQHLAASKSYIYHIWLIKDSHCRVHNVFSTCDDVGQVFHGKLTTTVLVPDHD